MGSKSISGSPNKELVDSGWLELALMMGHVAVGQSKSMRRSRPMEIAHATILDGGIRLNKIGCLWNGCLWMWSYQESLGAGRTHLWGS